DVAGADAADCWRHLSRSRLAIHVDYQRCLAGIVEALPHTHSEESHMILHNPARDLLLGAKPCAEGRLREHIGASLESGLWRCSLRHSSSMGLNPNDPYAADG